MVEIDKTSRPTQEGQKREKGLFEMEVRRDNEVAGGLDRCQFVAEFSLISITFDHGRMY